MCDREHKARRASCVCQPLNLTFTRIQCPNPLGNTFSLGVERLWRVQKGKGIFFTKRTRHLCRSSDMTPEAFSTGLSKHMLLFYVYLITFMAYATLSFVNVITPLSMTVELTDSYSFLLNKALELHFVECFSILSYISFKSFLFYTRPLHLNFKLICSVLAPFYFYLPFGLLVIGFCLNILFSFLDTYKTPWLMESGGSYATFIRALKYPNYSYLHLFL